MADPTLQVLATKEYPYEFAGANESGDKLFVGIVVGGTVKPITFPGEGMEKSFSRRIQSLDRHDTDLVYCAMNIANKYALMAVEDRWATTTFWERLRWLFRHSKKSEANHG